MMRTCALVLSMAAVDLAGGGAEAADTERWPAEKANAWYEALPWLVGCNFIPSTAINQLEMWQEGTFDRQTLDRRVNRLGHDQIAQESGHVDEGDQKKQMARHAVDEEQIPLHFGTSGKEIRDRRPELDSFKHLYHHRSNRRLPQVDL